MVLPFVAMLALLLDWSGSFLEAIVVEERETQRWCLLREFGEIWERRLGFIVLNGRFNGKVEEFEI